MKKSLRPVFTQESFNFSGS